MESLLETLNSIDNFITAGFNNNEYIIFLTKSKKNYISKVVQTTIENGKQSF